MVQVSIIGAGSVAFSASLVRDLSVTRSLSGSTVVLMDIDKERLNMVRDLALRYGKATNTGLRLKTTTSRKKALEGADFVICSVKVGGYEGMEKERKIAERYGYLGGLGDRVSDYYGGIGAYYQLRFFLDLAQDMEDMCPDAWLIMAANPVFEGTTLVARETKTKVIGVCHGHLEYRHLVEALKLRPEDISVQVVGFNHCVWLTRFLHKQRDAYPLIDEWIENRAERYWRSKEYLKAETPWETEQLSPAAVDMYKMYGLFPVGDTVRSVSPWWYHVSLGTKKRWFGPGGGYDSRIGWSVHLRLREKAWRRMQALAEDSLASPTEEFPPTMSGEQHVPFIDAIVNNKETSLQLNVPNGGAIPGIPKDVAVEIPVVVNGRGIRAGHVDKLPRRLMLNAMIPRMLRMEQALQAFQERDRRGLLLALMGDHRARSLEKSKAMLEEVLAQPWNYQASKHYSWSGPKH